VCSSASRRTGSSGASFAGVSQASWALDMPLAPGSLGGTNPRQIKTAATQQALLQIVRDFCQHSNALCDHCPFPELVKSVGR
jgi:hypothetical protein